MDKESICYIWSIPRDKITDVEVVEINKNNPGLKADFNLQKRIFGGKSQFFHKISFKK